MVQAGFCGTGSATVSNCYNTGNILGTSSYAGGICGFSNQSSATIAKCYNTGSVIAANRGGGVCGSSNFCSINTCFNSGNISSDTYAGGICGYSYSSNSFTDCYNKGDISPALIYLRNAGGICGNSSGSAANCYNSGCIYADSSGLNLHAYAGGIFGNAVRNISNCHSIGDVYASADSNYAYAGGLSGYGPSSSYAVANCHNRGNVFTDANDGSYAGGICGYSSSDINNCLNRGRISAFSTCTNGVFLCEAGGIKAAGSGIVANCYNTNDISAFSISTPQTLAGGICGSNSNSRPDSIINCYSTGSVSASNASSLSIAYTGGICGRYSNSLAHASNCVVLSHEITAYNAVKPTGITCYIIGYNRNQTNNLALANISGNAIDDADRRISESEARSQATYEALGWDFAEVWEMVEGYDYPQLRGLAAARW